ncbi:Imm49 family immunity protein, partial [Streptomyces clavuligerus]
RGFLGEGFHGDGGDAQRFALEEHRAYYQVGDRNDYGQGAISPDILALACHARRRGWPVRVDSPYLPPELLHPPATTAD